MALADISKEAILAAVREFDQIGRSAFLKKYGFRAARDYFLVLDGKYYDSKALMGVAHGYQFPALGPLLARHFSGGAQTARPNLERLGFEVTTPTTLADQPPNLDVAIDDEDAFPEGKVVFGLHRSRERSRELVKRRKALAGGDFRCQACGFDFAAVYGRLGQGFIECHHTQPISQIQPGQQTRVKDLALVCSNCHRMLHRRRPWLSLDDLSHLVKPRRP